MFLILPIVCLSILGPPGEAGMARPGLGVVSEIPGLDTGKGVLVAGFAFIPAGMAASRREVWHLRSGAGTRLPSEVRLLGWRPGGGPRSARVTALLPRRLLRAESRLLLAAGPGPTPPVRLRIEEDRDGVRIDTGVIVLQLARTGADLVTELEVHGRRVKNPRRPVRIAVNAGQQLLTSSREARRNVRVERRGVLTARLLVSGLLLDDAAEPAGTYKIRMELAAGSPLVELVVEVRSAGDFGIAEDLALELPIEPSSSPKADLLAGGGRSALPAGRVSVAALDGRTIRASGRSGRSGDRGVLDPSRRNGLFLHGGQGAGAALAVSRMRPNAPRAVEASRDGSLRFLLHAGPFFFDSEFAARARLALLVARNGRWQRHRAVLEAEPRPQLRGVDPRAPVMPGRVPLAAGCLGVPAEPLARLLPRLDAALGAEIGYPDYGDYRYGSGHANLEYDPAAAFLLRFLMDGDARHWLLARDQLDHWFLYDRSRGQQGAPRGLPWMHGREHFSRRYEAGHVWAEGLVLGALLSGDPDWAKAVGELEEALVELCQRPDALRDERSFGWALLALEQLQAWKEMQRAAELSERICVELLRRQEDRGFFLIDRPRQGSPGTYAPTPWVTGGIVIEALHQRFLRSGDRSCLDAIGRAAAFLIDDARGEGGEFCKRIHVGGELGGRLERVGRASAVDLLMIAAGLGRAALHQADPRAATLFQETLLRATSRLQASRASPNQAARGLVAVRSLAETVTRLGSP